MILTVSLTAEPSTKFRKCTRESPPNQSPIASTSIAIPQSTPVMTAPAVIPVDTQDIPASTANSTTSSKPQSSDTLSDGSDHSPHKKTRAVH